MTPQTIWIAVPLAIYVGIVLLLFGTVVINKEAATAEAYALGSRDYTSRAVFFTAAASMIGPAYSIGVADRAYDFGFLYTIFYLLFLVQLAIFGYWFAHRIQPEAETARTTGDIIGRYFNDAAQGITGLATVSQAVAFAGVLVLGGGRVLNYLFGLNTEFGLILVAVLVALYSIYGGMPAVMRTDKLQFGLLCAILVCGVIALIHVIVTSGLHFERFWVYNQEQLPPAEIIGTGAAFLLGEAFIPIYTTRGLIAGTPENARSGFLKAAGFGFVWFILLSLFGIAFHSTTSGGGSGQDVLFRYIETNIPITAVGLLALGVVGTGILSAVMSTLDSVLNAGAVSFVRDILGRFVDISEDDELHYARHTLFFIAVAGTATTLFFDDLVELLLLGYKVWVPTVVLPLGYILVRKESEWKYSAIWAMLAGTIGYFGVRMLEPELFPPILGGLVANGLVFFAGEAYGRSS